MEKGMDTIGRKVKTERQSEDRNGKDQKPRKEERQRTTNILTAVG